MIQLLPKRKEIRRITNDIADLLAGLDDDRTLVKGLDLHVVGYVQTSERIYLCVYESPHGSYIHEQSIHKFTKGLTMTEDYKYYTSVPLSAYASISMLEMYHGENVGAIAIHETISYGTHTNSSVANQLERLW